MLTLNLIETFRAFRRAVLISKLAAAHYYDMRLTKRWQRSKGGERRKEKGGREGAEERG